MVRPINCRNINFNPHVIYYKPAGVPMKELKEVILELDEIEALRLSDLNNLKQEQASKKMKISQSTFFRILSKARKKLSDAIINGKAIKINK